MKGKSLTIDRAQQEINNKRLSMLERVWLADSFRGDLDLSLDDIAERLGLTEHKLKQYLQLIRSGDSELYTLVADAGLPLSSACRVLDARERFKSKHRRRRKQDEIIKA